MQPPVFATAIATVLTSGVIKKSANQDVHFPVVEANITENVFRCLLGSRLQTFELITITLLNECFS